MAAKKMTLINENTLISFLQGFADCYFSEQRPLLEEVKYVGRLSSSADVYRLAAIYGVSEAVDMYHQQRLAFRLMEFNKQELLQQSDHAYTAAANKILWMNTRCREYTGEPFVTAWVNVEEDKEFLVERFMEIIHEYVSVNR